MDTLKVIGVCCCLLSLASGATAYNRDDPRYYKAYKYKAPPVRSVTFTANGARSENAGDSTENCAAFKLTERHIKEFFRKARAVSQNFSENELGWSPCYAEGTVVFSNGEEATWSVSPWQDGAISITNGKNRGKGALLYCEKCDWSFEGLHPGMGK